MDAASLHDCLRSKLDNLEARLETHRQNLLGEFHRHYLELTRPVAPSAVTSMRDKLGTTLDDYKVLRPSLPPHPPASPPPAPAPAPAPAAPEPAVVPAESPRPPVSDSNSETTTTSQTLSLAPNPADSGYSDAPGSPRDRDHELQGLFTPSYLSLLAASHIPADDTLISPTTKSTALKSHQSSVAAGGPNTADTEWLPVTMSSTRDSATNTSMDQSADEDRFPGRLTTPPRHRPSESEPADAVTADEANSSASSDKSDNKAPRSALRRSSSILKTPQSPRRVRFEFMGAEFLPTASPQPSDTRMPQSASPLWESENVTADSVLGQDADDLGPPPRKISSSDALRALSREPLEEDTVWTVVNPDSDIVTNKMRQVDLDKQAATFELGMQQSRQELSNDERVADDDVLDVKTAKATTLLGNPPTIFSKEPPKNKAPVNDTDIRDDDDDMFQFEDEGSTAPSSQRLLVPADGDEQSDDDENAAATSVSSKGLNTLRSPTTVAPAAVPAPKPEAAAEPSTPTTPRFHVGSVGSYKGRSVMMPVVKSPEIHAKAAAIGNFNSFVGGLDGTSGIDAADLSSYRASFMRDGFSGTPRSFTERLMMEDMEAERLAEGASQQP
ncbi:hypothetical protein MY1884_004865 [Beauveria asiatica]